MKKIEGFGFVLIFALLIHRVFVGMELQVLLRVLLTLMSIFYMWFGFFLFNRMGIREMFRSEKRKQLSAFQITGSIGFGFLYSFSFISIMFAVNFYAGMHTMIFLSWLFNLLILLGSYMIYRYKKAKVGFIRQFMLRSFLLLALFSGLLYIPVEKRLDALYKEYPGFIEAYNDYVEQPGPETLNHLKEERSRFR